jgi:hypothetical protein
MLPLTNDLALTALYFAVCFVVFVIGWSFGREGRRR